MTTNEFKKMFPDKAHLEGDALWNAMEDYFLEIKPTKPDSNPLVDWMGNTIKAGHIVCVFRTRSFIRGPIMGGFMNSDTPMEQIGYIPDKFLWELVREYVISYRNGKLRLTAEIGDVTMEMEADMAFFGNQPTDVVCIKGLSDDKDKYIQFMGGIYSEEG